MTTIVHLICRRSIRGPRFLMHFGQTNFHNCQEIVGGSLMTRTGFDNKISLLMWANVVHFICFNAATVAADSPDFLPSDLCTWWLHIGGSARLSYICVWVSSASDSVQASNDLAKAFSLANSVSASLSRSPSKKMRVRRRSSRQQPWWLFVIALSYVLILTFSSAASNRGEAVEAARVKAATGCALQQSNPELSAVKNAHPEVYENLAKARLKKRAGPEKYTTVRYPGEKLFITRQNELYMFHFLNRDGSTVMRTQKWSELPDRTKAKYHFLEGATNRDDTRPHHHNIQITGDMFKPPMHTYEDPMMPAQNIHVWRHEDGKLEFEYRLDNGKTRRLPSHKLPAAVQSYVENLPEIREIMEKAASSSRGFRVRK
ncbi:uncharacterized protein UHOD_07017 [Ustilago sp. UG-2017b]|nr:uncharacterized protein UHOD_07017 [Ustilago sp. UG-2017b]